MDFSTFYNCHNYSNGRWATLVHALFEKSDGDINYAEQLQSRWARMCSDWRPSPGNPTVYVIDTSTISKI